MQWPVFFVVAPLPMVSLMLVFTVSNSLFSIHNFSVIRLTG